MTRCNQIYRLTVARYSELLAAAGKEARELLDAVVRDSVHS